MFKSKSLEMVIRAFSTRHPSCDCIGLKEQRSDYEKRRLVEKAGGKVLVLMIYAPAPKESVSPDAEAYAIYRIDHSTGRVDELAFGVNNREAAYEQMRNVATPSDLLPIGVPIVPA